MGVVIVLVEKEDGNGFKMALTVNLLLVMVVKSTIKTMKDVDQLVHLVPQATGRVLC